MKPLFLAIASVLASHSTFAHELPDTELAWRLGSGTKIVFLKDVILPANISTVTFCSGRFTTSDDPCEAHEEDVCQLEFVPSIETQIIEAESSFTLTKAERGYSPRLSVLNFDHLSVKRVVCFQRVQNEPWYQAATIGGVKSALGEHAKICQSAPRPVGVLSGCEAK